MIAGPRRHRHLSPPLRPLPEPHPWFAWFLQYDDWPHTNLDVLGLCDGPRRLADRPLPLRPRTDGVRL